MKPIDEGDAERGAQKQGDWWEVSRVFLILGLTSFGGPTAHIGFFRDQFVKKKAWLSDSEFTHWLALCQFLPGPASSQLGFVIGLLRAGWRGALAAFISFTLPSVVILVAAAEFISFLSGDLLSLVINALKVIAIVVVGQAIWNMSDNLWRSWRQRAIGLVAIPAFLLMPLPLTQLGILLVSGALGVALRVDHPANPVSKRYFGSPALAIIVLTVFSVLLLLSLFYFSGTEGLLGVFSVFYQSGALVFGGGHVVLPLLETPLVEAGLIDEVSFISGYGLAQALPGPLFSVATFYGYEMWGGGLVTALVATLAIFLPGFLLIFAAAPFWQVLSSTPVLIRFFAGVNAAVLGLLLSVWGATLLPAVSSLMTLVLALVLMVASIVRKWSPLVIVWIAFLSSILLGVLTSTHG